MEEPIAWQAMLIDWGIKIVIALAIFLIGKMVAGMITGLSMKAMSRARLDDILVSFLGKITYSVLIVCVMVAALSQLGINVTSLLAILGAAGLAVGLALKDSLSNFASGVMIISFKPFKLGDFVSAGGASGTVVEIGLFNTLLNTPDNQRIIVPNASIMNNNITNVNTLGTRRIDLVMGISYGDDIAEAKKIIQGVVEADERVLTEPAFGMAVAELADSSVNLNVRPWCKAEDYWALRWDLIERIKIALEEGGVTIPFPQRDVHIHGGESLGTGTEDEGKAEKASESNAAV